MIAVIFEVWPEPDQRDAYLTRAVSLRPLFEGMDGFISIERFESLTEPGKLLSLSMWRDEAAIAEWRAMTQHRAAQTAGRGVYFKDYRLRIAEVARDYSMVDRDQAPEDSRELHG